MATAAQRLYVSRPCITPLPLPAAYSSR